MNQESSQSKKDLKDSVFEKIESEQVCPRSRFSFMCHECMVWALWIMSVVVGALAVAVSVFVMSHNQYAIYEATHDNLFTFMVDVLPFLWIVVFGLMVYVAVFNLRHTKRGYRYSISILLFSSIILSFAGGSALHHFGLGYTIDDALGRKMAMYMSQDKLESKLWQAPREGRLIGSQVLATVSPTSTIIFEDIEGQRWTMNVSELFDRELKLLASKEKVRLLGMENNQDLRLFHACGVFPWMLKSDVTKDDIYNEREAFAEKVYIQTKKAEERLALLEQETFSSTSTLKTDVCANIAAMRRMPAPKHE